MRCETHCPPEDGAGLRAPLLAVAGFLGLGLAVYVVSSAAVLMVLAAVAVVAVAGLLVVPRVSRRASRLAVMSWPVRRQPVNLYRPAPPTILQNKNPAAIAAAQRRALPAARPAVQGVVVREGERIGR